MSAVAFVPLNFPVEVLTPGETVVDMYGNEIPSGGQWVRAQAASWWVDKTEEKGEDSVLRTIDFLHVHLPPTEAVNAASRVRLPDGTEWDVVGNPEDYRHGFHGFDPGLVVVHARKVEG